HQLRQTRPQPPLGELGVGLVARKACADPLGQHLKCHLADIMAVSGVAGPGIPEPGYEPDVIRHEGSCYSAASSAAAPSAGVSAAAAGVSAVSSTVDAT